MRLTKPSEKKWRKIPTYYSPLGRGRKFIAEGAKAKGMAVDKIFTFDTIDDGKSKLREEVKQRRFSHD